MVLSVLFFTVVMEALIAELHFPEAIHYLNDIVNLCLLIMMLVRPGRTVSRVHSRPLVGIAVTVLVVFSISATINTVAPILYFWALRNTFRGFVFFLACVTYLNREDLPGIFDKLLLLQVVSLVLALYQHFVLGLNMDDTGGIFGHGNGAGVNPFNALLFAYYLNMYMAGRERLWKLVVAAAFALVIAGIAEEKVTYFYLLVILVVSLLFAKASKKAAIAVFVSLVAGYIGLDILRMLYPDMFTVMSSLDTIDEYLRTSYDEGYMLPRVGSFQVISDLFFRKAPLRALFGVGFGNGETGSYSFLNGPLYLLYGYLHYRWFTHQWTFIECGWVGFISYLAFFVVAGLKMIRERISGATEENRPYLVMGIGLCLVTIISIWYNATLKVDMCYIAFFSMAVGFVSLNSRKRGVTAHV